MKQHRFEYNSYWYHETQSTLAQAEALVPEAADIADRFLLGLATLCKGELQQTLHHAEPALRVSRDIYQLMFPRQLATSLHTLTLYDRLSTALTVAQVTGVQRLCDHYAARLNPLPGPDSSRESNQRLTQITEYARQLASQPTLVDTATVRRLDEVGLTVPDIITLSQIIGFISYQARVVAGFNALLALPVRWNPGITVPEDAEAHCFAQTGNWQPRLPLVELRYASDNQLEALTFCLPQPALKESAWLLAHDGEVLYGWSMLINTLEKSLMTTEGKLTAAVAARINGSPTCFHRLVPEDLRVALRKSVTAAMLTASPFEQAIIQAAAQLTRAPERFSAAHLQPLAKAGLPTAAIFTTIVSTALAGWSNRLMQSLGSS